MKDIRNRIKSVQGTMQITKAMELVASSKMRKAKDRALSTRPYFETLNSTMMDIGRLNRDYTSLFTKKRNVRNTCYIVVAGDRGLAGGYNANILKFALHNMQNAQGSVLVMPVGKKSTEHYSKCGANVIKNFDDVVEQITMSECLQMSRDLVNLYKKDQIDEAYIVYTKFVSPLTQEPKLQKLLPVKHDLGNDTDKKVSLTEYDPSPVEVFNSIVPLYISGVIFGAISESFASEQAARRLAMQSAGDNAQEMIDALDLSYNRARQAAITQEITEIVAGAQNKKS